MDINLKDIVYNKRKVLPIIITAAVLGFILSPFPGTEAILMALTSPNTAFGGNTQHQLDITVLKDLDDTPICAGDCNTAFDGPETIGNDKRIHIIIDEQKGALAQKCVFKPDGTAVPAESSNCLAVTSLVLDHIEDSTAPGIHQNFGYGLQYFYGRAFSNLSGYFGQLVGDGSKQYGLTANVKNDDATPFGGDVTAFYDINFEPLGLSTGTHNTHSRIVDPSSGLSVLKDSGGPQSFTNSAIVPLAAGANFINLPGAFDLTLTITCPPGATCAADVSTSSLAELATLGGGGPAGGFVGNGIDIEIFDTSVIPPAPINACPCIIALTTTAAAIAPVPLTSFTIFHNNDAPPSTFVALPTTRAIVGATGTFTATTSSLSPFGGGAGAAPAAAPGPIGAGGGGGGGGVGGPRIGLGTVKFYEASWDVCDSSKDGTVSILGGTDGSPQSISAKIRTAERGVAKAVLAADQPFEEENKKFKAQRLLFVAPIDPKSTFFTAYVEDQKSSVSKTVQMSQCSGKMTFEEFIEEIPTTTPLIPGGKTFKFTYDGHEFTINYRMDGTIIAASVDENTKSVSFTLSGVTGGELLIALPRGLVDATNDQFITLVTAESEREVDYDVTESTRTYAMLQLMLPQDATQLTVVGTSVIPEFGVIAVMVLAMAIISIVALTRMGRLNLAQSK